MSKRILAILMAVAMAFSLLPVTAFAATEPGQNGNVQNPNSVTRSDEYVTLEKTAAKAEGSDNTFNITLKVTASNGKEEGKKTSTDAVLVIDRSASMGKGNRLTSAQNAAKRFAEVVLGTGANSANRIAVVSYAKYASVNTGLTSDLSAIKNAITFSADGGTNIQAGIKTARDLLTNSNADKKVIVVLSDGEPTYSFRTVGTATQTNCRVGLVTGWHYTGTIDPNSVNITGFSYGNSNNDVVGTGGEYKLENGTTLNVTCKHGTYQEKYTYYENNGQPTIQEAAYAKTAGYEIYSIYLGSSKDTNAISTMKGIATDENHYRLAQDAAELGGLFKGIAEDIIIPVIPGTVTDPMGEHMSLVANSLPSSNAVSIAEDQRQFTWDLTRATPTENTDGSRTYTLTYQITFDTDFDGFNAQMFYPTNGITTLRYTVNGEQKTANFPIPQVKGTAVTYSLTYNANGGHFGSEASNTTKVETIAQTGTHSLNYTNDYTPTYTANGKTYVFLGWSADNVDVSSSTYSAAEIATKIITSVDVPATGATVYAVWGLDDDNNDVPDVFEATITYKIENGQWTQNGQPVGDNDITATFQLYEKQADHTWKATDKLLRNGDFPDGWTGTGGYTGLGWYRNAATETTNLVQPTTKVVDAVTGAKTVFTYKYAATPTKTCTVVLHLADGSYATTPATYTKSDDVTYQYTVNAPTALITPAEPSRNNYSFEGWNLSANASQSLIDKNATFASLYLSQSGMSGSYDKIDLYAVWKESEPSVTISKKVETVDGETFDKNTTVARKDDSIVWSITVTNEKDTPATVTLTDTMVNAVYTDNSCTVEATSVNWNADTHTWTATVAAKGTTTYYVNYTVTQEDIYKGKVINTVTSDTGSTVASDPVSTWDTKQFKSATSLTKGSDGNWTTTVTLTLPTVEATEQVPVVNAIADTGKSTPIEPNIPTTRAQINAVSEGSYVIDKIGNEFTFVPELTLKVGDKEYRGVNGDDNNTYNFGEVNGQGAYPYTVTYIAKTGDTPAQFKWAINENVPAGTKVTLSYKLKLTSPKTAAGTYGVEDLNGNGGFDQSKALYTNESAILYDVDHIALAVFPKPSVSYTVQGSSGGHSSSSRPTLNTKDHYGFVVGYPDGTVQPEGKITRAEVATIYFRMLTDESRTKFWSQSNAYSDVKAGDWFNNAVSTLSNAGIISGYEDGTFRPNGYITRAEFATIAARFFDAAYNGEDLFPDISGHWAKDYINQAANKGFVNGYEDGTFKPNQNITRAEAVTLVNRTLDRHPDKSHFTKDMLTWPDNQDETKWYYADMQEATNSHTYESKENSDKTKYENWTKTLSIRNWEALEKEWSDANSSQGTGNVV